MTLLSSIALPCRTGANLNVQFQVVAYRQLWWRRASGGPVPGARCSLCLTMPRAMLFEAGVVAAAAESTQIGVDTMRSGSESFPEPT